ncbi:hypothetical protein MJL22_27920, partial [Salmonella enterica subsp. enterica serovar Montevideo]|nr:hypothetical protein [Salmonella enterica subsp. enterica serovar Montevideo]
NTILDLGYILLVTGVGDNKDLDGALKLYSSISKDERLPLKILLARDLLADWRLIHRQHFGLLPCGGR